MNYFSGHIQLSHLGMLAHAFSNMSAIQWETISLVPRLSHARVESLNKCSIDIVKSNCSKTFESCLEYTYRQDKKTTLEHLYASSGLPISYQRKILESCKQRAARQKKARNKAFAIANKHSEDNIGLKGS